MARQQQTNHNKTRNPHTAYLLLTGSIEAETVQNLADILSHEIPEGTETLYILFSTSGGSVTYGFAMYHLLRALPYKIIMHNIGSVDSIGVVIFLAGDERYTTKHGTFLIHRVNGKDKDEQHVASKLREELNAIEVEEKKITSLYRERAAIPEDDIKKLFQSGELKNAKYAIRTELAHEIREIEIPKDIKILVVKSAAGSIKS